MQDTAKQANSLPCSSLLVLLCVYLGLALRQCSRWIKVGEMRSSNRPPMQLRSNLHVMTVTGVLSLTEWTVRKEREREREWITITPQILISSFITIMWRGSIFTRIHLLLGICYFYTITSEPPDSLCFLSFLFPPLHSTSISTLDKLHVYSLPWCMNVTTPLSCENVNVTLSPHCNFTVVSRLAHSLITTCCFTRLAVCTLSPSLFAARPSPSSLPSHSQFTTNSHRHEHLPLFSLSDFQCLSSSLSLSPSPAFC